jgi:hypothetical protein
MAERGGSIYEGRGLFPGIERDVAAELKAQKAAFEAFLECASVLDPETGVPIFVIFG